MVQRHTLISYLKVGYLLHYITIVEILLIVSIINHFGLDSWVMKGNTLIKLLILYPLWSPPIFAQLDARSRYQNYKQIKDQLFFYGFKAIILKPVLKSRCQRDAAVVAAEELGLKDKCASYFYSFGYRWYHLLPDFFFTKPTFLLKWYFWKTTFFVKTYQPKFNFKMIEKESRNMDQKLSVSDVN